MRALLLLLATTVGVGCAQQNPGTAAGAEILPRKAPGRYVETIKVGEFERGYILRVPKAYDATKRLPLVVVLHGWTASGALAEAYTRFGEKADQEGFFLVSPDGLGRPAGWNAGFLDLSGKKQDDVAFIETILNTVEKEVGVDPDRVYVAGHSNGAMLAHLIGARLGNRVAAIGAVAGVSGLPSANGGAPNRVPDPKGPVSVMIIHGKQDATVAYGDGGIRGLLTGIGPRESARWWAERMGAKAPPEVLTSSNGNIVTETYRDGRDGTSVKVVSIENGLHDWPGGLTRTGVETISGISATDILWDFFIAHPRRR
jgi:polyhydroxybutyrate depolymerase